MRQLTLAICCSYYNNFSFETALLEYELSEMHSLLLLQQVFCFLFWVPFGLQQFLLQQLQLQLFCNQIHYKFFY
jgi:hypothetical protein